MQHGGNNAGVVSFLTFDFMPGDEFFPAVEDGALISIEGKELLYTHHLNGRVLDRHAKPVVHLDWTSADRPVFIDDLCDDARFVAPGTQRVESSVCLPVMRVRFLHKPE